MVQFPHAKINLGLQVIDKRRDGFHNIISCLYPITWCDILEIIEGPELKFTSTGLDIPGSHMDNSCLKAYHLIADQFAIPPVQIHLHKVIPTGAGLGGGSSDATQTLKALHKMFNLPLQESALAKMASQLGSDCPFFINNRPALVTGKGDKLENIDTSLSQKYLVVVTPAIQVNTGQAYSMLVPQSPVSDLKESLAKDINEWSELVTNDFEKPVFNQFPSIAKIKETLLDNGALYSSLSGSGSSVFGIFEENTSSKEWFDNTHLVWEQQLS